MWSHYVRYIPCGKFRDIVKLLSKIRSPKATDFGVIYRKDTIMKHLSSEYYKKIYYCLSKKIDGIKKSDKTPLTNYISKENSDLVYKIGSILIMVYYDANKLVLFEYYFSARAVVNIMAS